MAAKDKGKEKVSLTAIKRLLQGSVPNGAMRGKEVLLSSGMGGHAGPREVCVPDGTDAYSGTVRSHEGRHLAFSPIGNVTKDVPQAWLRHPLMNRCCQIAEDCYVESRPLPTRVTRSYLDMHIDTAAKDVRALEALASDDPATFANRILLGARAYAMGAHYGDDKVRRKSFAMFGGAGLVVDSAVKAAVAGNRKTAALLLYKVLGGDLSEIEEEESQETDSASLVLPSPSLSPFDAEEVIEALASVDGKPSVMQIIELARSVPTRPRAEPIFRTVYPDSGSRINSSRLVHAVVSNDPRGVFIQHLTEPAKDSVLLIDASGSMHIGSDALEEFCRQAPNATVAYYYGTDNIKNPEGWLYVYAKNGKRYDGETQIPCAGNSVDLPAMKWAMQQRGHITLVSDLGFCGCSKGEIAEAHGLVERLKASGRLTVMESLGEAIKATKGADHA